MRKFDWTQTLPISTSQLVWALQVVLLSSVAFDPCFSGPEDCEKAHVFVGSAVLGSEAAGGTTGLALET